MDYVVTVQMDAEELERESVMIEVKRNSAAESCPQNLQALQRIFETNCDRKPVFGFATNGVYWIPMSYDGNEETNQRGYHVASEINLTKDFINKSDWKAGEGPEVPKLIYKILSQQYNACKDLKR